MLVIEHRDSIENSLADVSEEEFWQVRSKVLSVLQRHSLKVGPDHGSKNTDFWLVEDQFTCDRFQTIEVNNEQKLSESLFLELSDMLVGTNGWGIWFSGFSEGRIALLANRMVLMGTDFASCETIESVVLSAQESTRILYERKFGALRKQIEFVGCRLKQAMENARNQGFAYVVTFDHYSTHERYAIWLLQSRNINELKLITDCGSIAERPVDSEGVVFEPYCEEFWPYTDREPEFWLVVYLSSQIADQTFRLVNKHKEQIAVIQAELPTKLT